VQSTAATCASPTGTRPHIDRDHITLMLVPELDELANAVAERRLPCITAADGRRVLQVLDAVVANQQP
jgi:hypothetical protein